jgi:hypothetical protein
MAVDAVLSQPRPFRVDRISSREQPINADRDGRRHIFALRRWYHDPDLFGSRGYDLSKGYIDSRPLGPQVRLCEEGHDAAVIDAVVSQAASWAADG